MVGIHGPLGAGAVIGRTGARISHGCIRLHDRDLARLSDVPAGTPVTIVSSSPFGTGAALREAGASGDRPQVP